jgi:glycosyltransferase involved in cell wall biosynthesis
MNHAALTKRDRSSANNDASQASIRVLHIIHSLSWGGAENQVVTLAPLLNSDRYAICVCCLQSDGAQADILRAKGIQVISLKMRIRYFPIAVYRLFRLMKQLKPQIVHNNLLDAGIWGTLVGKLAGVPVVITSLYGMLNWKKTRHKPLVDRIVIHFTDMVIAVSEEIRQNFIKDRGISPTKITTIPSAVDIERFNGGKSADELRIQLGIKASAPIIGTVARLVRPKRLDYLLQAARIVCDAHSQACFLIIGDGPLHQDLRDQADKLKLSPQCVRFLGNRQDVADLYSGIDIFALSSETEGVPVSMLEAMAASRPVIATRVGGIPQVIKDGHNGLLVQPHHPEDLARAILSLIEDKRLRESIAIEGLRTTTTHYSASIISQQIIALYDDLLSQQGDHKSPRAGSPK